LFTEEYFLYYRRFIIKKVVDNRNFLNVFNRTVKSIAERSLKLRLEGDF